MSEERNRDNNWHLDKRVPLALIVTLVVGFVAIISWSNETNARLSAVERLVLVNPSISDRLTRLEVQNETIQQSLLRIESHFQPPKPEKGEK